MEINMLEDKCLRKKENRAGEGAWTWVVILKTKYLRQQV